MKQQADLAKIEREIAAIDKRQKIRDNIRKSTNYRQKQIQDREVHSSMYKKNLI